MKNILLISIVCFCFTVTNAPKLLSAGKSGFRIKNDLLNNAVNFALANDK
jgi:hypothetical protein